jgi:hypothetical protein
MDWIKKNWMWIAVGLLIIAIIAGVIYKNKKDNTLVIKLPKVPKMPFAGRGMAPTGEAKKTKAQLQKEYDACMLSTQNIRLASGAVHPCAATKDMLDKAESGYFMQGGSDSNYYPDVFGTGDDLNIGDFAIGLQGTSLERGMMPEVKAESGFGRAMWGINEGKADLSLIK